jgi:hypothetical protein
LFPENEAGEEKLRGGAAGKGPPTSDEVKKQTLDEHLDPSDAFPPAPSPITGLTHFNLEISETKQSSQMKELQSWTFWEAVIVPQLGDLGPRNGEYQCTGQRWRSTAPSPYKTFGAHLIGQLTPLLLSIRWNPSFTAFICGLVLLISHI